MRNIWLLLKNYFICGVGNLRRKNARNKTIIGITTVAVLYAVFFAVIQMFMLFLAKSSTQPIPGAGDLINSVLAMGLIISVFMALIFALQKITGGQKANDTELLLSMPFKRIEIIIAKTLSSFVFNLAFVILFFLPSVIAYLVYTPFNLAAILGCSVVLLLIPLMAVGLSAIIDFLVSVCFSNTKFGNIAKAFFTIFTLIAVIAIYEFFSFNLENPVVMNNVVNWIITFNPVIMIPVIIIVLLIFILGCWLNSLLLKRENRTTRFKKTAINKKVTTPLRSLLKNETNRYFNSPSLMINTLIGPLGVVAMTGWLIIDQCKSILPLVSALGLPADIVYLFIGLIFASLVALTYPAAVSISLEGKQLWILRSMPISAGTVLTAKALFNIILVVPLIIICGIALQIGLKISILNLIIMMIIPCLTAVLISYAGVLVNLWFPKLEYENENTLLKQSTSAVIMMFAGIFLIFSLIGLSIWLLFCNLSFIVVAIILISILLIITALVIALSYTVGQRIFNHL